MANGNQEQAEYWNGEAGRTWVESVDRIDALLEPVTQALIARAGAKPGEQALDVGCGCGTTTLALADCGAAVWGVDLSEAMIETARKRAAERSRESGAGDCPEIRFSCSDAASQILKPDLDLLISRFGVMFFADPVAAFSNLHTGMKAGGRLCCVAWQTPAKNPWMAVAGQAVAPFLPAPEVAPDPRAPGPFAFAEQDYVRSLLEQAGWSGVGVEPLSVTFHLGDSVEEAMAFQSRIGPVSRALAELSGRDRERALDAASQALGQHATSEGIDLGAACWLITATA